MRTSRHAFSAPILAAGLAALALAGCEFRPNRGPSRVKPDDNAPAWFSNPPIDARLIYAVGADPQHDRAKAMTDARRNLASQLHVVLRSDGSDLDDGFVPATAAGEPPLLIDDLPGVQLDKQFDAPSCLYVMITFNRAGWADALRARIDQLDGQIRATMAAAPAAPEATSTPVGNAARNYLALLPLVREREEQAARLRLAAGEAAVQTAPMSSAGLRQQLAAVAGLISVDINADPNLAPIQAQLNDAAAGMGLNIVAGNPQPALRVRLSLQEVTALNIDGLERLDATFVASVENGKDGRNLGGLSVKFRSSGLTDSVARERLNAKLMQRWKSYLENEFVSCLQRL